MPRPQNEDADGCRQDRRNHEIDPVTLAAAFKHLRTAQLIPDRSDDPESRAEQQEEQLVMYSHGCSSLGDLCTMWYIHVVPHGTLLKQDASQEKAPQPGTTAGELPGRLHTRRNPGP